MKKIDKIMSLASSEEANKPVSMSPQELEKYVLRKFIITNAQNLALFNFA